MAEFIIALSFVLLVITLAPLIMCSISETMSELCDLADKIERRKKRKQNDC